MKPPPKPDTFDSYGNAKWTVKIDQLMDCIAVYAIKGMIHLAGPGPMLPWSPTYRTYVYAANKFDRILGITTRDKLLRAIKRVELWCKIENAKQRDLSVLMAVYSHDKEPSK